MTDRQLTGAYANGSLVDTFFGAADAVGAQPGDAFDLLLASSGDPHLFVDPPPNAPGLPVDDPGALFRQLLGESDDEVSIEITGAPTQPIEPGDKLDLECSISAPDRFRRPFEVSWSMRPAGRGRGASGRPADRSGESSMRVVSLLVSDRDDRPEPGGYEIVAEVYDGSPDRVFMGRASTGVEIGADPEVEVRVKVEPEWSDHDPFFALSVQVEGWNTLPIDPEVFAPLRIAPGSRQVGQRWGRDATGARNFVMLRFDYAGTTTSFLCSYRQGSDTLYVGRVQRTINRPWVVLRPRMIGRMPVRMSIFPGPNIRPIVHEFSINVVVPPATQAERETLGKRRKRMDDLRAYWMEKPDSESRRDAYYNAWQVYYEGRWRAYNRALLWLQSGDALSEEINGHVRDLPGDAELLRKLVRGPLADRALAQLALGNPAGCDGAFASMEGLFVRSLDSAGQYNHVRYSSGRLGYADTILAYLWQRFDVETAAGLRARVGSMAPRWLESFADHTYAQWQYDAQMVGAARLLFPGAAFP